ncbi:MAG TPA: 3-hydroxyacyl-ACP dehydratase FabZ family protein [Phycisphaerae bacterium]|nr:3-hydroxyacyl-ACP dehydratase FabZ family protein [Phycisphaerae bacterium]
MRWIWIDRLEIFEPGKRALAIKNVSLAEDHLHDHFPGFYVMPASLMIEGMAQTSGILVGDQRDFKEKVILAKIGRANFQRIVRPGEQIVYDANVIQISEAGAAIQGHIRVRPGAGQSEQPVGEVEMMFSHIDQNMTGMKFPEFNFVFNSRFMALFENIRRDINVPLDDARQE